MASSKPTIEDRLDRVFGIKDTAPDKNQTYAASIPPSLNHAALYIEEEPTVKEYLQEITPSWRDIGHYVYRLFPFISWIGKYNLTWGLGDLIAGKFCQADFLTHTAEADKSTGVTVGAVVVPQSMAYAQLALLDVEYGLYSSFMGVLIYWFFATSKDITIGVSYPELFWQCDTC